ncbi:helix-turn-helix transcriptional regulator [Rhodococcoides fascians]|uniref:helix-turn-helix transcriptional regulator n=1 Tax=Rhodococcoides fascians TaxID=1828 RepID=UPI0009B92826|nr:helix-turn-helix transcriptional regulator [Rhodococcus fascians]
MNSATSQRLAGRRQCDQIIEYEPRLSTLNGGNRLISPPDPPESTSVRAPMTDAHETLGWLASLTETLSEATDAADLSNRFLQFGRDVIGAPSAALYLLKPQSQSVQGVAMYGVSDFFLSRYEEFGRNLDPVLQRVLETKLAVDNHELMNEEEWRASALYQQVLHLHSFDYILQIPVLCAGEISGIAIFAGTGHWEGREKLRSAASAIGRIVGTALIGQRRCDAAERHRDQVVRALELVDEAVVVTDAQTGQRHHNRQARTLLDTLSRLGITHFDDLLTERPRQDGVTAIEVRVAESDRGQLHLSVQSVLADDDPSTTITMLRLRTHGQCNIPEVYAHLLSRRELDVATLVVDGLHDVDIAQKLSISQHTVKQYLKSVYRKLGVNSRVDLVRLVFLQGMK